MSNSTLRDYPVIDLVALLIASTALHAMLGLHSPVLNAGGLLDTDAYMRLIRVEELWSSSNWYQIVTAKLGAPDGLSLHWTRPLDVLILLPSLFLTLFGVDLHRAIYWSGIVVSPALHALACISVAWAARPLFPQHGAWRLAALILLLNGAALGYSLAGRPDHHPLCILTIGISAGYTIRAMLSPASFRPALLAGIWAGAGVWVAPEILLTIAPALLAIGFFWLFASNGYAWATLGYRFGLGLAGTILVGIAIEQPINNWLAAEYDKISILYFSIALAVLVDFKLASLVPYSGWRRIVLGILIAGTSLALLSMIFPRFYLGSLGNIDAAAASIFIDEVAEMQPLWPGDFDAAMHFFRITGNTLAAIPAGLFFLWTMRRHENFAPILYLCLAFALTFSAAMLHLRLAISVSAFGSILGCGLFAMICQAVAGRGRLLMLFTRLASYFVVAIGLQIIGMLYLSDESTTANQQCDPLPAAHWLDENHPGFDGANTSPIILTDTINTPPTIAYLTDYRLVGGPYHRGNDDVADMVAALASVDAAQSFDIIRRRQVDLILVCTKYALQAIRESPENSLYHGLLRGESPSWLRPITMSGAAGDIFRLFAVVR